MLNRYRAVLALALAVVLSGCSNSVISTTAAPSVAAPAAGTATVTGQLVANNNSAPIEQVLVRLAPLFKNEETGDAAFALDTANAPGAISDAQGYFSIPDVAPNNYVIVVGDQYGVYDIVIDNEGKARAYAAQADKVLNAGVLPVKPDVTKAP